MYTACSPAVFWRIDLVVRVLIIFCFSTTDSSQDPFHDHSDIKMVLLSAFAIHCSVFCDRNFYGRSGVCLALHITPEKPSGWEYSVFVFLCKLIVSFNIQRQGRREKVKFSLSLNICHKDMLPLS
jgi:hypothetical protein